MVGKIITFSFPEVCRAPSSNVKKASRKEVLDNLILIAVCSASKVCGFFRNRVFLPYSQGEQSETMVIAS